MSQKIKKSLETKSYKGTRDFYPRNSIINWSDNIDNQQKQNHFFTKVSDTLVKNGFVEYSSSVIEEAAGFVAKSGEDLGSNQLYSFMDKGDRKIALRPELTLSVARMIADKFDNLRFPLRWFSIDNCFRYERPQKGRLREFWQVEVNIIGQEAGGADLEIMRLVVEIFLNLGAKPHMYKILYNHRVVLDRWVKNNNWQNYQVKLFKILDNWFKTSLEQQTLELEELLGKENAQKIIKTVNKEGKAWEEYQNIAKDFPDLVLIDNILSKVYPDIQLEFTPAIIRGQAYYTGLILECFDCNKENPRSLFGGGRFDDLLDLYGKKAPAVGFAPGEVSMGEFLDFWKLYPEGIDKNNNTVGIIAKNQRSLEEIFTTIVPELIQDNKTFDIDYDYTRSINKREESLKKRGVKGVIII